MGPVLSPKVLTFLSSYFSEHLQLKFEKGFILKICSFLNIFELIMNVKILYFHL